MIGSTLLDEIEGLASPGRMANPGALAEGHHSATSQGPHQGREWRTLTGRPPCYRDVRCPARAGTHKSAGLLRQCLSHFQNHCQARSRGRQAFPAGSGGLTGRAGWVPARWVDSTPATWDTSRPVAARDVAPGRAVAADPEPRCRYRGLGCRRRAASGRDDDAGDEGHRPAAGAGGPPKPPRRRNHRYCPSRLWLRAEGRRGGPARAGRGADVRVVTVDTNWSTAEPVHRSVADGRWSSQQQRSRWRQDGRRSSQRRAVAVWAVVTTSSPWTWPWEIVGRGRVVVVTVACTVGPWSRAGRRGKPGSRVRGARESRPTPMPRIGRQSPSRRCTKTP